MFPILTRLGPFIVYTYTGMTSSNYLLNNFILGTTIGVGPRKTIDVAAGSPCSPFKLFGTWSVIP